MNSSRQHSVSRVEDVFFGLCRAAGHVGAAIRGRGRRAAVIPPTTPGSVGDAAMLAATIGQLRLLGFERTDLFYSDPWPMGEVRVDARVPAQRFLFDGSRFAYGRLLVSLGRYTHVFYVGADVVDGAYNPREVGRALTLLKDAAGLGADCVILGSSFSTSFDPGTRDLLRALPPQVTICGRDPHSVARMEKELERPIRRTADLAFLVTPDGSDPSAVDTIRWIEGRRGVGDRILAVNANLLHAQTVTGFGEGLARFLDLVLGQDVSVILVPHDSRTSEPDEAVLAAAAATLDPSRRAKTRMVATDSPAAIKAVLEHVDLLASGRMHAMILALGAGTPAFGFVYQDKFEGLMDLLGLATEGLLSSPAELATDPVAVATRVLDSIARSTALREQIRDCLPGVVKLSQDNFGGDASGIRVD